MASAITQQQAIDVKRVATLSDMVNRIDAAYIESVTNELHKYQPFVLSMLLGYRLDLKPAEFEEVGKIVFLIWEYFKTDSNVKTKQITETQYNASQTQTVSMLLYLQGETSFRDWNNIINADLKKLQSEALLAGVYLRFDTREPLLNMAKTTQGILLAGMKNLIECFENL